MTLAQTCRWFQLQVADLKDLSYAACWTVRFSQVRWTGSEPGQKNIKLPFPLLTGVGCYSNLWAAWVSLIEASCVTNFLFSPPTIKNIGDLQRSKGSLFLGGLKILECRVHKSKAIGWSIWKAFEPFSSLAQLEGFACSRGEKDKKRRASQQVRQLRMKAEGAHVRYSWRLLGVWVWGKRIPGFSPGRCETGRGTSGVEEPHKY